MIESMDPLMTRSNRWYLYGNRFYFLGFLLPLVLSVVSLIFLVAAEGVQIIGMYLQRPFTQELNSFVLLSIPMFILNGNGCCHIPQLEKTLYTGLG